MIIGIDGNEANVSQHVGVSVYTQRLLHYFQSQANEKRRFRVYLKKKPLDTLPSETPFFTYHVIPGPVAWSQFFFPLYLHTFKNCDVLFSPAHYAPRSCPVPFVVTIHDLSYFYYPDEFLKKDLYTLKNWTQYSIQKAHTVICVSKTTKKDVRKWYNTPDHKLHVIYNGYEKQKDDKTNKTHTIIPTTDYSLQTTKYLLYVGTLQPRKNIQTLIEAFAQIITTYPDYKLVIAGKKGWLYEDIFAQVQKRNLTPSVIFPGFVSDEELEALYTHATCYILPSLYEGFGIPVLEAMSYQCPVIVSYTSSLPEVGGEACLYFDPHNPKELAEKITIFISDKTIRDAYIQKGEEQIKKFSWEQCGKETLKVLENTRA